MDRRLVKPVSQFVCPKNADGCSPWFYKWMNGWIGIGLDICGLSWGIEHFTMLTNRICKKSQTQMHVENCLKSLVLRTQTLEKLWWFPRFSSFLSIIAPAIPSEPECGRLCRFGFYRHLALASPPGKILPKALPQRQEISSTPEYFWQTMHQQQRSRFVRNDIPPLQKVTKLEALNTFRYS